MKVKVLGTGCEKCRKLYAEAEKAIAETGVDADLEKVENLEDIMNYGLIMTPALVIDEEVKSAGKIPKSAQIITWITEKAFRESP